MYVMDKPGKWEDCMHLVEFAYNNHFQVSAGLSPFKILYGWKCNNPISWSSSIDGLMLRPGLLKDMELMWKNVQNNLKVSQDRKKSYDDLKITTREFQVGEYVYVKVAPRKISLRLGK